MGCIKKGAFWCSQELQKTKFRSKDDLTLRLSWDLWPITERYGLEVAVLIHPTEDGSFRIGKSFVGGHRSVNQAARQMQEDPSAIGVVHTHQQGTPLSGDIISVPSDGAPGMTDPGDIATIFRLRPDHGYIAAIVGVGRAWAFSSELFAEAASAGEIVTGSQTQYYISKCNE